MAQKVIAEKRQPYIFVLQENNYDFTPAEKFGEVRFITRANLRSIPTSQQNAIVENDIDSFFVDYEAGHDFIITTGDPMMTYKLAYMLGKSDEQTGCTSDVHQLLKWDGRRGEYIIFKFQNGRVV